MKIVIFIIFVVSLCFSQDNYSGYGDTTAVSGFQSTGTGTTRNFELSKYEDILLYVMADDTSSAGYDSDSIKFVWGIEFLNMVKNSSGLKDTAIIGRILCDTFDIATGANLVVQTKGVDTVGTYNWFQKFIDTASVTGYAIQHAAPIVFWSPVYRFWYTGLTGNITGSYVPLIFGQSRRLYSIVHNQ